MRYTPQINVENEGGFRPLKFWRDVTERVRWPVMAIIILYLYLAFHALSGSQGIVNWMNNDARANSLRVKLETLEARHAALEEQVDALNGKHLDLDALDQVSREKLFYSHPKELTIWLDPQG
jgi:cell division protein FtsB